MEVDELKIEYYQINGLGCKPEQCRAPAGDPPSRMDDLQSCIFLMQNLKRRRHALARERVDQGLHIPGSVRPISFLETSPLYLPAPRMRRFDLPRWQSNANGGRWPKDGYR